MSETNERLVTPPLREVPCPTCGRLGRVPKQYPPNTTLFVSEWPMEMCRTCHGSGWVLE